MADELIQIESKNIKVSRDGICFVNELSIDEWKSAWDALRKIERKVSYTIQFCYGDLACYAESKVTGWGKSKYDELCEWTGLDNKTIRDLAWIARRFDLGFRKNVSSAEDTISFRHFKAVAPLDDNMAYQFLARASEGHWSSDKLREEVHKYQHPEQKKIETTLICPNYTREELEYVYSVLEGDDNPRAVSAFGKTSAALGIIEME
jgi:hypothetical protein